MRPLMKPTSHNIMKTKFLFIVLFIVAISTSCENNEFPDDQFSIKEIEYGTCKPTTKSTIEEYMLLSVNDNYFLKVEHINAMFNCSPGQIIVIATVERNEIIINEYETEGNMFCICPYDLNYVIGPLRYDTYNLVLQRDGLEVFREVINFKL